MAWQAYDNYKLKLFNQVDAIDHDDAGTTIKIALLTNVHTIDLVNDDFWADVVAEEVSGTNYTTLGNVISTKTLGVAGNVITWDADDPATWAQSGAGFSNARYAVLFKDTGVAATSPLIAIHDFTTDQGNVAGDLTIQLDALGILTLA